MPLTGGGVAAQSKKETAAFAGGTVTIDLRDFGATGDGATDDGPALQKALDALSNAGGGTLLVPEGRYAILTPVEKDFSGLASTVEIRGVESSTPVAPPTAPGHDLTRGLDLRSEFLPRTGAQHIAMNISGLERFLIRDVAFVGTPGVDNDALVTLRLSDIDDAVVEHCEFYGLAVYPSNGAILWAHRSRLTISESVFLGCTGNSGLYVSVVQNTEWKGISVTDAIFADYGQREFFSKTGLRAALSWVNVGNAAPPTRDSPRREAVFSNVFLDEGAQAGISSLPYLFQPPSAPIDLLYVTGLYMNVSNLGSSGHFIYGPRRVLIENSQYGRSHYADTAINLLEVGEAILDRVVCTGAANRIRAWDSVNSMTVVNSTYAHFDAWAKKTKVLNTPTDEDDPVFYVRRQFQSVLGREPDAAGHFYWSDRILRCGEDAACVADVRSALAKYLSAAPSSEFSVRGRVSDEKGDPLSGATVALSGPYTQTLVTTTDADGEYAFSPLPTSGSYTLSLSKRHYTFTKPVETFADLAGDHTIEHTARLDRHSIGGRALKLDGSPLPGVTVALDGALSGTKTTTDADGKYVFANLPAGGDYAVSASKEKHIFILTRRHFSDLSSNQTADFTGGPADYKISGRVRMGGEGLAGVDVALRGTLNLTTTTGTDGSYSFSVINEGDYTVTPSSRLHAFKPGKASARNLRADAVADFEATLLPVVEFEKSDYTAVEGEATAVLEVKRTGDTSGTSTVVYMSGDGTARQGHDVSPVAGRLVFAPGETSRTVTVFITGDASDEDEERIEIELKSLQGAVIGDKATAALTIKDDDAQPGGNANPIDDARFFVRQHYRDFLNRDPDTSGLDFWAGEIAACGGDARCVELKRVRVSAAFFLSIEFQQTGYFVYRAYRAAYESVPRHVEEFLLDARQISEGVVVGAPGWEDKIEANKKGFLAVFVASPEFQEQHPHSLTPRQFVAALNANTGGALTAEEVERAVAEFKGAHDSADEAARGRALRVVVENAELARREFNPAFVLMQYYGYLQRNPDEGPDANLDGYNFWLRKLDAHGGDFERAEMVKAFLDSAEYRTRFGQ